MALGDLVTADYMFEYNGLVIGANTDYDLISVTDFLGYESRSTTADLFGRHGGSAGRIYANTKTPTFEGKVAVTTDTDFQTKRQALASAFAVIVDTENALEMVTMLPGPSTLKVQALMRPSAFVMPMNREHALKYAPYLVRFEMVDPILHALVSTTTVFTMPSDTETITNNGNAPANWTGTLAGPAENPLLTNNDTGQTMQVNVVLTGSETLVFDSFDSTIKKNGVSQTVFLSSGFSWWDLAPGNNSISITAANASTAAFSITHRDAYWSV